MTQDFWDTVWEGFDPLELDPEAYRKGVDPSQGKLLDLMGDVEGAEALDLGCGNGLLSVYLAKKGARVTAVDDSSTAVENTAKLARLNKVDELIEIHRLDAMELGTLDETFDLAVGSFILHHLEPFEEFADILAAVIRGGGRGIFLENNARNATLMFFRKYLVGRFGVPKCGDKEEHPFEPREIEILRKRFAVVDIYYPEFMFFSLLGSYLFKERKPFMDTFNAIDGWVYRNLPYFNKYSYRQIVEVFN